MNPEQRRLDTFDGQATDRAPVVPKIWLDRAARLTGREPCELIEDPQRAVLTSIDAAEQTGCDAARVLLMPRRQTQTLENRLIEIAGSRKIGAIDLSGGWATHLDNPADFSIENPMHVGFRKGWCKLAGQPQTEAELEALRRCVARGQPYGGEPWVPERRNHWDRNQRCEHHTGRKKAQQNQ